MYIVSGKNSEEKAYNVGTVAGVRGKGGKSADGSMYLNSTNMRHPMTGDVKDLTNGGRLLKLDDPSDPKNSFVQMVSDANMNYDDEASNGSWGFCVSQFIRQCPADSDKPLAPIPVGETEESYCYDKTPKCPDNSPKKGQKYTKISECYYEAVDVDYDPEIPKPTTTTTTKLNAYPSVQFLGGGLLSSGEVKGNRYVTLINDRVYGSLSEYAIVSGGVVTSFASGNAFGYNGGADSVAATQAKKGSTGLTDRFYTDPTDKTGYSPISSRNKQGGGLVATNAKNASACLYSKMTIYNYDCDNSIGKVGDFPDESVTTKLQKSDAQRLKLEAWFKPEKQVNSNAYGNHLSTRTTYDKNGKDRSIFARDISCSTATINIDATTLYTDDFLVICSTVKVVIRGDIKISNTEKNSTNIAKYTAENVPQVLIFS
jgi:hypothetical protein